MQLLVCYMTKVFIFPDIRQVPDYYRPYVFSLTVTLIRGV